MLDVDVKGYFERFGEIYTRTLIDIGFPPCPGNVMVSNPEWRMGVSEWEKKLKGWFLKPEPENTLKLGIFFDFRNAFGSSDLVERLKDFVFRTLEGEELFIAYMLLDAIRFKPPIGFMRRFVLETKGEHRGELDIKKGGIFPITQGIRALSLKQRSGRPQPLRDREAEGRWVFFPRTLQGTFPKRFTFPSNPRLRNQIEKVKEGKPRQLYKPRRD
ncbi:MAG: putative nucleotidyltransferase substrate binding domain-containing protein [Aquificota bacterium]|nr:putative nucleotidyltransferase substrate binding domain-containing protein [Aquificota bacterium]